ncbi:hypothetical protein AOC05_01680 [Arthrobacter alpinus]|uniref:Uncharacterized protein n=1 Tax=Arthrobacter alpinus TaxID=656366 RepID=A0A0M4QUT5_9MICC|nr:MULTISPECIES: hypothetical protein [Arthrobacter]ALE91361.1 hypothetical protein AOC05_01680 [Arthrobacter alpinus]
MAKTPAQRAAKHGEHASPPRTAATNPSTQRTPAKAANNANMILIAGAAASLFLFWYLHVLTLSQMTDLSGGLSMPDSMVFGFDVAHIEALRAAMDAAANGQLQFLHKTAGMLFPLVFGITSMTMIAVNVAKKPLRRIFWAFPILFAIVQIWANFAIDGLLSAQTLDAGAVAMASALVVASWFLLVISLATLGVALFLGRRRKPSPAAS